MAEVRSKLLSCLADKARKNIESKEGQGLKFQEEKKKMEDLCSFLNSSDIWPKHLVAEVTSIKDEGGTFLLVSQTFCHYSAVAGPFKPIRLVISAAGEWKLTVNLVDVVAEGKISLVANESAVETVITLAAEMLSDAHVLCPGLDDPSYKNLENQLGYLPKSLRMTQWPEENIRSQGCAMWFRPQPNLRRANGNNDSCASCYKQRGYVDLRLKRRHNLTEKQRRKRQSEASHLPDKYLSPVSKKARNLRRKQKRVKLSNTAARYRKKTSVLLTSKQSKEMAELCELVSEEGQELERVAIEANEFGNIRVKGKTVKRGDLLKEIWNQEKSELIRDQQQNGV